MPIATGYPDPATHAPRSSEGREPRDRERAAESEASNGACTAFMARRHDPAVREGWMKVPVRGRIYCEKRTVAAGWNFRRTARSLQRRTAFQAGARRSRNGDGFIADLTPSHWAGRGRSGGASHRVAPDGALHHTGILADHQPCRCAAPTLPSEDRDPKGGDGRLRPAPAGPGFPGPDRAVPPYSGGHSRLPYRPNTAPHRNQRA